MPLFGKAKTAKYDYYLLLHTLSPFPANYKSIYISWQRGSDKRGQTQAVGPTATGPGRPWATYQFEEALHVDCTLHQVSAQRKVPEAFSTSAHLAVKL